MRLINQACSLHLEFDCKANARLHQRWAESMNLRREIKTCFKCLMIGYCSTFDFEHDSHNESFHCKQDFFLLVGVSFFKTSLASMD